MIARLRMMIAIACSFFAFAMPVDASEKADQALKRGALAQAYADKCKSLKVDWVRISLMLEDAGVDVDKLTTSPKLQKMIDFQSEAIDSLKGIPDKEICKRAVAEFGPKGTVRRDLLSDGLGASLQNKLFDWMHKKGF